jgi:uncharacterized protein (TIGR02284 family)
MTNEEIIEKLNELIQLDFDASKTYEAAIERVDENDDEVRSDLQSFLTDHLRHITDLTQEVQKLGGKPEEVGRDFKGVLLEGMTKLRSVTGTSGALKAMRMNEKVTNKSYEEAAEAAFPVGVHELIVKNLDDERRHLAAIELHIARRADEKDLDEDIDEVRPHDDEPTVRV